MAALELPFERTLRREKENQQFNNLTDPEESENILTRQSVLQSRKSLGN